MWHSHAAAVTALQEMWVVLRHKLRPELQELAPGSSSLMPLMHRYAFKS
jgi:hypothetical protein